MLFVAAIDSSVHRLFLALHIISVLVAFAPAVIHPVMTAQYKKEGDGPLRQFAELAYLNSKRIYVPALIAIGVFGVLMVVTSDDAYTFGDTWVSLGLLVWLAIVGVITGVLLPNERKLAAGDLAAEKTIAMGGQIATVLLLVMLYLMIWKPGA